MYKVHPNGIECGVLRIADDAWIPSDVTNKDWKEYLAWVELGNEPLPWE